MDKVAKFTKLLREAVGNGDYLPIQATVTAVEKDFCSVRLLSGLELTDVKLKVTISKEKEYMVITPVIGSEVLLLSTSGRLDNLTVIKVNKVQKIEIKQNGLQIITDSNDSKISVKNDRTSLLELLLDLSSLLKQLKVFTPSGPSGTPLPNSIASIIEFENKCKQLIK